MRKSLDVSHSLSSQQERLCAIFVFSHHKIIRSLLSTDIKILNIGGKQHCRFRNQLVFILSNIFVHSHINHPTIFSCFLHFLCSCTHPADNSPRWPAWAPRASVKTCQAPPGCDTGEFISLLCLLCVAGHRLINHPHLWCLTLVQLPHVPVGAPNWSECIKKRLWRRSQPVKGRELWSSAKCRSLPDVDFVLWMIPIFP